MSDHPGFTGAGFLDFQHSQGDWVEWTVSAATAGSKASSFHYANGEAAAIKVAVAVNGTMVNSGFALNRTGSWGAWGTASLPLPLKAGANTVRITSINAGQPNIDHLSIAP